MRGLKLQWHRKMASARYVAPHVGAWIEIEGYDVGHTEGYSRTSRRCVD